MRRATAAFRRKITPLRSSTSWSRAVSFISLRLSHTEGFETSPGAAHPPRGAHERLSRRRASALTFGYASGSFPSTTPAKLGVSRSHADCLHKSHGLP
ncbi:hypothetical protein BCAR13_1540030 [Paraburkholderia caribensis]|nr:hypothetical protein BCAR13_1540030 [Paraburkholderia caribensis]